MIMLGFMRKCSQNIVVRILLFMLAMAFVVWGVGDVLRGANKQTVATVAGTDISYAQYHQTLEQYMAQLRETYGSALTLEQMQLIGLDKEVVERLINDQLIGHRIKSLNIGVGEDIVQEMIMSNPNFANASGQFDSELFSKILKQNNFNEIRYIQMIRQQQSVNLLLGTLTNIPPVLRLQIDPLLSHRFEQRLVDVMVLSSENRKESEEPTETQLLQFYNDHPEKFSLPELRTVSYLQFDHTVIKDIEPITDEQIQAEYENRKSEFVTPPMRQLEQYLLNDEQTAKQVHADLIAHKEVNGKIALGMVSKESLPTEVQEKVFALEKGGISEPVQSPLGWHIFIVSDIVAETTRSLDEVKEQLKKELTASHHADAFYQWMSEVETQLSSGVTLEEIAKKFNLTVRVLSEIDSRGLTVKGEQIKNIPDPTVFLPLVFKLDAKVESSATALSDSQTYVVARVDQIMPTRTKALDEAKGIATELWKQDEKAKRLSQFANALVGEIKDNKLTFDQASRKEGVTLYPGKVIKRVDNAALNDQKKQSYPPAFIQEIFISKLNMVTSPYMMEDGSYVVGRVIEVIKADKAKVGNGEVAVREELQKNFVDEILAQYLRYLKSIYKVERNDALLKVKAGTDAQ